MNKVPGAGAGLRLISRAVVLSCVVMTFTTVASAGPAVAYQIDPAHTGSQPDGPTPPLTLRWSRDMGGSISYPLIVGGKVFVTARNKTPTDGYYGTSIYALDAATGATLWGPKNLSGTYPWSSLAYENSRVFALNYDGILRAFDATSGALLWQTKLANAPTEAWAFTSAPTALNGLVYTGGSRYGGTVFAVSEQDGSIKWTAFNPYNADFSSPAVSSEGVYVSYRCHQYDYSPATGNLIWHHARPCFGGGGSTAVLYGNRLYARDSIVGNMALDVGTGEEINGFGADLPPAFSGSTGYYYQNISTLQARDVVTGGIKWTFKGDDTLNTAPIVVNGYVYVGSHSGQLYALDNNTGTVVWTGTLGSAIPYTGDSSVGGPMTGLGAAEGIIVVPAENLLVAYESGGSPPTPTPTPTPGENPIDQPQYLVNQHYLDFLNRGSDQSGFDFWVNQITLCGSDTVCREVRRINVSAAFYLSIEFQETGYFVERVYKAAYGDATAESTLGGVHQLKVPIVRLNEFLPDVQQLGWGVVVGSGSWQYQLDQNKNTFTYQFDHRARFVQAYPYTLTPTEFANRLFANAGITPTPTELAAVTGEFSFQGDSGDPYARARALRDVAENSRFIRQENNRAFVLMQYFGYLRRNPNDLPDADHTGYDFWLTKLDQFGGNYIQAEMVKAFISSDEYRKRFGQ